jgi:cell division protein FtsZ
MGLFEVNEAAEVVHAVAHQDANIIFGTVIDDEMGDEIKVTVIAAGFERWDTGAAGNSGFGTRTATTRTSDARPASNVRDIFSDSDPLSDDDDDFDVPSFLK